MRHSEHSTVQRTRRRRRRRRDNDIPPHRPYSEEARDTRRGTCHAVPTDRQARVTERRVTVCYARSRVTRGERCTPADARQSACDKTFSSSFFLPLYNIMSELRSLDIIEKLCRQLTG